MRLGPRTKATSKTCIWTTRQCAFDALRELIRQIDSNCGHRRFLLATVPYYQTKLDLNEFSSPRSVKANEIDFGISAKSDRAGLAVLSPIGK